MSKASEIYSAAVRRARVDHEKMVAQFLNGEIEIASPCGTDRERDYIIADFAKALEPRP